MTAAALLSAFALSCIWAGKELFRQQPRDGRIMASVSLMVVLAVFAGGALTGGGM